MWECNQRCSVSSVIRVGANLIRYNDTPRESGTVWRRDAKARAGAFVLACATLLAGANDSSAQTQWQEGGRPGAMGGAFLAISNDANALAYNPAGLVYAPQTWMAEFSLQNPFASGLPFHESLRNERALTVSSFGLVHNHLRRPNQTRPVLVLGDMNYSAPAQTQSEPASVNTYSLGLAGSMFNSGWLNHLAVHASFSKGFWEKAEADPRTNHFAPRVALSATAKFLGLQYDGKIVQDAEVNSEEERAAIAAFFDEHRRSAWGFGLDVGFMAELHARAHVAMSWNNLIPPNVALAENLNAPRSLRAGLALLLQEERHWLLAMDYEHSVAFPKQRFYLGMESSVFKSHPQTFRLRAGVNRNWLATGFMLAKPGLAELHYAFMLPTLFSEDRPEGFFQHRFSLSFTKK